MEWVRRGGTGVEGKRVQRLVLDPTTRVLRFGLPVAVEVPATDRAAYWHRVGPYVLGRVRRVVGEKTDDHFDCEVAEFRDEQRRVLVAVYETC